MSIRRNERCWRGTYDKKTGLGGVIRSLKEEGNNSLLGGPREFCRVWHRGAQGCLFGRLQPASAMRMLKRVMSSLTSGSIGG
jgi:hypothetical protein